MKPQKNPWDVEVATLLLIKPQPPTEPGAELPYPRAMTRKDGLTRAFEHKRFQVPGSQNKIVGYLLEEKPSPFPQGSPTAEEFYSAAQAWWSARRPSKLKLGLAGVYVVERVTRNEEYVDEFTRLIPCLIPNVLIRLKEPIPEYRGH